MDDITKKIILSFENLFSSEDKFKDFLIKSNSYYRYNYYNQGIIYHDNKYNRMVFEGSSDDIINRDKYITIYKNVENKYIPVKVYDIENFNNSFELSQKEDFFKLNDQDKIATLRYINSNTKDIFSKASDKLDGVVTDKQLKKSIAEIIYTISLEKLEINSKIKLSNIGNILSLQNKAKQYILSVISNTRKNIISKTFKFIKDIKEERIYEQGKYERGTNENNQSRGTGFRGISTDGVRYNRGTQQQNVSGYASDERYREVMHRNGTIDRQQDRRSISTSNKSIDDRGRKEQRVLFCKRRSSKQNNRYSYRGLRTLFYLSSVVPRRYRGRGYIFLKTRDYITSDKFIRGKKSQCKNNISSIKIIKDMQKHDRSLTKQERDTLALYVGFGGISEVFNPRYKSYQKEYSELKSIVSDEEYNSIKRSTLTAFYTPKNIIEAMYKGVMNLGFDGGNILEPSMGIGNFFGSIPRELSDKTTLYGVEIEPITGQIAKALYPSVNIEIKGYQDINYPDNLFDLVISNIPFGDFKISDKEYNNSLYIHDYFFRKSLDKLKPNGLIAFITSTGTLDKKDSRFRKDLSSKANLLHAIRLPSGCFNGTKASCDIIFLSKKPISSLETDVDNKFIELKENKEGVLINEYFVNNPDNILGEMVLDRSIYRNNYICKNSDKDFNLTFELDSIISKFKKIGTKEEVKVLSSDEVQHSFINSINKEKTSFISYDSSLINFTFNIIDNKVYYKEDSVMIFQKLSSKNDKIVKHFCRIKDSMYKLIDIQKSSYNQEDFEVIQKNLNIEYDSFVSKFGFISSKSNVRLLDKDMKFILVSSLEIEEKREDKNQAIKYKKSSMFYKATIYSQKDFIIKNGMDALSVSINNKGCVSIPYMAKIYNKSEEYIIDELKGHIFFDSFDNMYKTADEYLSGNVKEKLKIAQRDSIEENIEALEKVIPKDLSISEISFSLSSTFIPLKFYKDFIFHLLKLNRIIYMDIDISYEKINSSYKISSKSQLRSSTLNIQKYGTKSKSAIYIIEDTLNLKSSTVYKTIIKEDGKPKKTVNFEETQIVREKQEIIKNEFINYIINDEEKSKTIEKIYNDTFNVNVVRRFNGDNLYIPNMTNELILKQHQKDGIMRIMLGGNTLLAHEVGAGKTFTMIGGAMMLKETGVSDKSMFVVPNHLTEQWGKEFITLFPTANILVATKKDFERKNRQKLISKIATGDYDAVIISFSQFEKIPVSKTFLYNELDLELEILKEAISSLLLEDNNKVSVKRLETQKMKLEEEIESLENELNEQDDLIDFEDLGIDYLFVDEAHNYKNCYVYTKLSNVAGVGTTRAKKSFDILMKTKYITEKNKGKGVVFATGTPITNSITELYVMQRYLQPDALKDLGVYHFDRWASTFGQIEDNLELSTDGNSYRMKSRFCKFHNMPELTSMFHQVADIKMIEDLDIERPILKTGKPIVISVEPSYEVMMYIKQLSKRAETIKSGIDPSIDNMLKITMEGKAIAIDHRIVEPLAIVDRDSSKVYKLTENVYSIYKREEENKGFQTIFLDFGIVMYDIIKKDLVEKGMKVEEVAFIHNFKTDKAKDELFKKCRSGEVRVLIGSTAKMGAGTNIQDRMIALHHLDCPWRPSDIAQRNGRIQRQGNIYKEVEIYQYVTKSTFDSYLWQLQEQKQTFISQIITNKIGSRSCEDIDDTILNFSEIKAIACGNPLIKEKMQLEIDVKKLNILKSSYIKELSIYRDKIKFNPNLIIKTKDIINDIKADIKEFDTSILKDFSITLRNKVYLKRTTASEVVKDLLLKVQIGGKEKLGNYHNFNLECIRIDFHNIKLIMKGNHSYSIPLAESPMGNITRIENINLKLDKDLAYKISSLNKLEKDLIVAKEMVSKPFEKEDILIDKIKKLNKINTEINKVDISREEYISEETTSKNRGI